MRIFFLKGQPLIEIDYSHDGEQKDEKKVLTYFTKYLNILCHLSLDTLPFMFRYFLGSVGICQKTCVSLIIIYAKRHKAESDRNTSAAICKELPSVGIVISAILSGRCSGSWLMHCRAICIIFLSWVVSAIYDARTPNE